MKEDYDGAEPAPSSIAVTNLLRLAALADPDAAVPLRARASAAAAAFRERLSEMSLAMPQMCCALHLLDAGPISLLIIVCLRFWAHSASCAMQFVATSLVDIGFQGCGAWKEAFVSLSEE
jgi:uncharacterized protein YyaL (SSP411 family)